MRSEREVYLLVSYILSERILLRTSRSDRKLPIDDLLDSFALAVYPNKAILVQIEAIYVKKNLTYNRLYFKGFSTKTNM